MDLEAFAQLLRHGDKAAVDAFLAKHPSLLSGPALVNGQSADGFPLLGLACFFGHAEVVELLLKAGADPNAVATNAMRVRPLHSAVAHGRPEVALRMVRLLLAAKADPNVAQAGGFTPLHGAAHAGHLGLVQLLLGSGADPLAQAEDGRTAERLAEAAGHTPVYRLLQGWA